MVLAVYDSKQLRWEPFWCQLFTTDLRRPILLAVLNGHSNGDSKKAIKPLREKIVNLEKSGNVDINTELNEKQLFQAYNCLLFFKERRNLSHIYNFYHSSHRSVLVPSSCKFLATVSGKEETKTVKAARIAVGSFQESSGCAGPTT